MEQKNLKTCVFSVDTVLNDSAEIPIDIDFTLPDYYADISKILKCCAIPRISSKNLNGNTITVEGCVTVTVIYCGSNNCVSSYEYQYPFSKSFDALQNTDGCTLNVKSKCEYINCRAITSRKIDIHGAIGVYVSLSRRAVTDVISDCDDSNTELLRGIVPATIPMGMAEKYLFLEEEIELGSAQPDIRCVIRCDTSAKITDSKIMVGKLMVSGELALKILYCAQNDNSLQIVRYQLPFSQLIEVEGISDECDCESGVCVSHFEIKPRTSASGECRQLLMNAKLLITSECCCNNDVAVILDAYSRNYDVDVCKNNICFNKIIENINQKITCKKTFELPEGSISSVDDIWCETRIEKHQFFDNKLFVSGTVTAFIIAVDCEDTPVFFEKNIDFEYNYPINCEGELKAYPEINVTSINYTLTGECSIELRAELNICAAIYKCSSVPLITDIKINENKCKSKKSESAMTMYFANAGEKIWDISRKYLANITELKQINDINEDILTADKMILIPMQ